VGAALGFAKEAQISGYYEHAARVLALASSQGLRATHEHTTVDLRVTARTADGTGSGWGGGTSHRAADLDGGALAKIAVDKAKSSAKPTAARPGVATPSCSSPPRSPICSAGCTARSALGAPTRVARSSASPAAARASARSCSRRG
jgi:hypothetical protein